MPPIPLALLAAVLAAAATADIRSRRIPNRLVLVGLGLAWLGVPAWQVLGGGSWSPQPYLGALAGFATFLPFYLVRGCAAGDVKLMAVVGSFVGVSGVLNAAICSVFAGGALAAVFMLKPSVARRTCHNVSFMLTDWLVRSRAQRSIVGIAEPAQTAARLPYAVAIATGTLYSVWQRGPF